MKRILIFANIWDPTHDIMGFLPAWAQALRIQGAEILVVTQEKGDSLGFPVYSLEKRLHPGRVGRMFRAFQLLWRLRKQYDVVFVVMAPSWAAILSPLVRIMGKKSYLWYAVWKGSWKLRIAERLVSGIFCSVSEAFPFQSAKVRAIGQAIDMDTFVPSSEQPRIPSRILCLGRISPVKRIEVLLRAVSLLPDSLSAHSVLIAGGSISPTDRAYEQQLRNQTDRLNIQDVVVWVGRIGHNSVAQMYQQSDIAVNMTPAGSFDKAILEAMASGCIVICSNPAIKKFLRPEVTEKIMFRQDDSEDFVRILTDVLNMPEVEKNSLRTELRAMVTKHHSLTQWAHNFLQNVA